MPMSPAGRKFLTKEEGNKLKAYQDSVGVWTIGVGHTSAAGPPRVVAGLKITTAESDEILSRDLAQFEKAVERNVKVPLTQNQYDALVSLCFNIGPKGFANSSVVRALKKSDYQEAADAFLKWSRAGDQKTILLARRQRERALFLKDGPKVDPVTKAVKTTKEAAKSTPIATSTVIGTAVAGSSGILGSIGSWEAVAALGVLVIAGCVAYIIWKKYQDA
jgi:lysozyme